jgi:dodecin
MSEHIYKRIELVGSSATSSDDAIQKAIARAAETVKNLDWFEVDQIRGHINDGKVAHWQVLLRVGFRLEQSE